MEHGGRDFLFRIKGLGITQNNNTNMVIAVDFDGTIVEHRYPAIGKEIPFATATLKRLVEHGHRLILWSVREGELLDEAVNWCKERGVEFYAVNKDFMKRQKRRTSITAVSLRPMFLLTTATWEVCLTGG